MPSSIPPANSLSFLRLQMLVNKKDFLERQLLALEKRQKQINKMLKDIAGSMKKIEMTVNTDSERVKLAKHKTKKYGVELKTIEY